VNIQSHFENFKNKVSELPDGYLFSENIKYTNLKPIFEEDFDLIRKFSKNLLENKSFKQPKVHTNVSSIVENDYIGTQDYFSLFSQDFSDETLEISIEKDAQLLNPIELNLITDSGCFRAPNIKIKVGESSSVRIYVTDKSQLNTLSASRIQIYLGPFSSLEFVFTQDADLESYNFLTTNFFLAEGSNLKSLSVSLGSKMGRHHLNVLHQGSSSSSNIRGIYVTGPGQQMDHYTNINHFIGGCNSNQHYKGILGAKSRAVFNGKVKIHSNAAKASSEQLNNNLILDSSAEIDSKPELEIFNDDVKATHGSTVGQLNAEEIFYMQSRGVAKEKAIELLSAGFVTELLSELSDEAVQEQIRNKIEAKLKLFANHTNSIADHKA
jgi:Fe-S cluster assembly protein SufD